MTTSAESLNQPIPCDRGCERHARHIVTLPHGSTRFVCDRCREKRHCASCDAEFERWQMANEGGDLFCRQCAHYEPTENW
jgi:primosomal protein N'